MKKTQRLRPKMKICCISSPEETNLAMRSSADVLNLVGEMPSGRGIIINDLVSAIPRISPAGVGSFLLTPETTTSGILAHMKCAQGHLDNVKTNRFFHHTS